MGCAYTASEQPFLEADGHLVSSWAMVVSACEEEQLCPTEPHMIPGDLQEGQGHVLCVGTEIQAVIWVVSERENAKPDRKAWLFLKDFSRVDAMSCRSLSVASISLRKGGN